MRHRVLGPSSLSFLHKLTLLLISYRKICTARKQNRCYFQFFCFSDTAFAVTLVEHDFVFGITRHSQSCSNYMCNIARCSNIMAPPSIFYHYTSKESLEGILATNTIFCSTPHPATPGLLGGYVIKNGVFLTRMDPNNSKTAIAFNNYR